MDHQRASFSSLGAQTKMVTDGINKRLLFSIQLFSIFILNYCKVYRVPTIRIFIFNSLKITPLILFYFCKKYTNNLLQHLNHLVIPTGHVVSNLLHWHTVLQTKAWQFGDNFQYLSTSWQNQQNECAPSDDSDQPGRSVWSESSLAAWRNLGSLAAQADLSLRWAYTHFVCFVMSRLISFFMD